MSSQTDEAPSHTPPEVSLAYRALRGDYARGLAVALAVHVVSRLVQLAVLAQGAGAQGTTLINRLSAWDGGWFIRIATEGYPDHLDLSAPTLDQTTGGLAFFPAYPGLMRALSVLTEWPVEVSGVVITAIAAMLACAGIYALTVRLASIRVGIFAVALWSALPMSVVLSMVYSEALFTALAVWALVFLLKDNWLAAGALGFSAGLTRATGLGVGLAVVAAALVLVVQLAPNAKKPSWKVLVGCIMGLAGTPVWWLAAGIRAGRLDGWFAVQGAFWGSKFDFGAGFIASSWRLLIFTPGPEPLARLVNTISVLITLGALVLLVDLVLRAWRNRLIWVAPTVYSLVLLGLAVGSDGYLFSKMRFVIPMVPLLIPLAIGLARARKVAAICVLTLLIVASAWWGTFMLTDWMSAI